MKRTIQFVLLVFAFGFAGAIRAQLPTAGTANAATNSYDAIVLPKGVADPLEPVNRALWGFNKGLLTGVIKPSARVYRVVVCKPLRTGINNLSRNVQYPVRLLNNLLQARWTGARDETYRFLGNSTVGIGGIFDVAERWGVHPSDADFGQTLGKWGWEPQVFLMAPFIGPTNERDAFGRAVDSAANPLTYLSPYDFDPNDPPTYISPYGYFVIGSMYNDLSDSVDEAARFAKSSMDAYADIEYVWSFARSTRTPDFVVTGPQDESSLETLGSAFVAPKSPEFLRHATTLAATVPSTGRKLQFTFWLQPKNAPIVYVVPGLGSHRLASPALALAEHVYQNGYSAVCVSSAFNAEFMDNASTAALPADVPVDAHDLHVALTAIDRRLHSAYPNRIGQRALMGYSMGALHSLYITASQSNNASLVQFDRCVALDTPVRLVHAISKLDELYNAPLAWPATNRTDRLENTLIKIAALTKSASAPTNLASMPFEGVESKFVVGLTFRFILRDIIYDSQRRANQGVLQQPIHNFRREHLYREILSYNYTDYFQKFAQPYYSGKSTAVSDLAKDGDLRTYGELLRKNSRIHIVVNQNDFLLEEDDLNWLRTTIPAEQLTVLPHGGHLGNLSHPVVQQVILDSLTGMGAAGEKK